MSKLTYNYDNCEPVNIINYSVREWHPLPNDMVVVKGVANGREYDGVLFFGADTKRKRPV